MKYCWEHVDEMMEYRTSIGYSLQPMKWYLLDFSRYLKTRFPEETQITEEMVMKWCEKRETEQNVSYRSRISALKQYTLFLHAKGVCDFILSTDFLPRVERYTPHIFTDDELIAIFNLADSKLKSNPSGQKELIISVIFKLIYFCGLRPNEGRELLISDVNISQRTLFIHRNKTHKERLIPMVDDVAEMIFRYIERLLSINHDTTYLFPSPSKKCYSHKWLRTEFVSLWSEVKGTNNIPRVRVYDLRHRWATATMIRFLNNGEDLFDVLPYMSAYMGHQNFEDTAYYIHLLPEKLLKSKKIDWEKLSSLIPEVKYDQ